jgi:Pyruvate/2-oxoacid:ferredoxin oxidoreductase delta subunit
MAVRNIVQIDESKCNGCGLCIPNCAEGALKIIDGKARLIGDVLCDGLGACLGHCPQDAIQIIERDAKEFDESEVEKRMNIGDHKAQAKMGTSAEMHHAQNVHAGGCPGSRMMQFNKKETVAGAGVASGSSDTENNAKISSKLRQWPVQLTLVAPSAPYFNQADLLITADCVPFAYANYHNDFLKDKAVVVGCPKLDELDSYIEKLTEIIKINDLESITVLRMEVPCCGGMAHAAKTARDNSGVEIPIKVVTVGIDGELKGKQYL